MTQRGIHTRHVEAKRPDDWKLQLLAALAGAVLAAVATAASGGLPAWVTATVTVLATMAGWSLGRAITHRDRRGASIGLAISLAVAGGIVVRAGEREPCAPEGVMCFVGECEPFSVYAQNRYDPIGTSIRATPRREGRKVGSFAPNELVPVDGWVRSQSAYPHNTPPFDNDVWFHLADDRGWVAFAGVRADPTTPVADPGDTDGGRPAPIPAECSGTFR